MDKVLRRAYKQFIHNGTSCLLPQSFWTYLCSRTTEQFIKDTKLFERCVEIYTKDSLITSIVNTILAKDPYALLCNRKAVSTVVCKGGITINILRNIIQGLHNTRYSKDIQARYVRGICTILTQAQFGPPSQSLLLLRTLSTQLGVYKKIKRSYENLYIAYLNTCTTNIAATRLITLYELQQPLTTRAKRAYTRFFNSVLCSTHFINKHFSKNGEWILTIYKTIAEDLQSPNEVYDNIAYKYTLITIGG